MIRRLFRVECFRFLRMGAAAAVPVRYRQLGSSAGPFVKKSVHSDRSSRLQTQDTMVAAKMFTRIHHSSLCTYTSIFTGLET